MAVNKVDFGNNTLIDLTNDTVQVDTLLNGATAHAANGEQIVGEVNGVIYFENPQDYYNLSKEEREAINELVILNEGGEPLDASLITYGDSNVGAELQRLDNEITDLNNFKNNVSDAWNNSTTYKVGQYCIYNNILWKCLVQNIGQTPAEGTYWTKVTIGSEFNLVKNDIDTLNSNFNNYEIKILTSTETTSNVGTFSFNYTNELPNGGTLLLAYTANSNYWCKLYGFSNGNCILGISDFNNQNSANIQHTVYSYWLVKKS